MKTPSMVPKKPPTIVITTKQGLVCWFAWFGTTWRPGDPLGRGQTREHAVYDLQTGGQTQ